MSRVTQMMDELDVGGADPSYASTAAGQIVAWSRAATELLGYDKRQAVGARCWELMRGRDIYGERFCGPNCPVARTVGCEEALRRFALSLQRADGRRIAVHVSGLVLPVHGSSERAVVHVLDRCRCEGVAAEVERGGVPRSTVPRYRAPADLVWRELKILQLLADGSGTEQIAQRLFMRAGTVRAQVRSMRRTLGERSFAEALSAARGGGTR
jgi:PAS domain S-box-containing protein